MHDHRRGEGETHQTHKGVVELNEVAEALNALVILEGFEDFEKSNDAEKPVESRESDKAKQRVVVVILIGLTVELVFDQVGGDACQEVDDHSCLCVAQHHFLLRSLQLFVVSEVRTKQIN